jgi:hypothetical protein
MTEEGTIAELHPGVILEFHGIFMDERTKADTWRTVSKEASKIQYLKGRGKTLKPGEILDGWLLPDSDYFKCYIEY